MFLKTIVDEPKNATRAAEFSQKRGENLPAQRIVGESAMTA